MNIHPFSELILQEALNILENRPENKPDPLNRAWSYMELALCYSGNNNNKKNNKKSENYYNKALELLEEVPTLCKASILSEYGDFICQQGLYKEAIEKYRLLETYLQDTEFQFLKARNYYSICSTYFFSVPSHEKDEIIPLQKIRDYLDECQKISEKLELQLLTKVINLRNIMEQI